MACAITSVLLFAGVTRSLTLLLLISASIVMSDPFVVVIAYSLRAILSDVSSVNTSSDKWVCVPFFALTRILAER